jgi:single-stranded DNA-binding protein
MNTCSLSGRLTWDPELRYQSSGKPELYFRLSVPNGGREGTQFYLPYDIVVYGKDCEPLAESLVAGDLVELTGQNAWPKAPRKPGGKWIPAAICFSVTRLSGPALSEHEPAPEYEREGDDVAVPSDAPEPVPAPPAKKGKLRTQGPGWKSQLREPWTPAGQN